MKFSDERRKGEIPVDKHLMGYQKLSLLYLLPQGQPLLRDEESYLWVLDLCPSDIDSNQERVIQHERFRNPLSSRLVYCGKS